MSLFTIHAFDETTVDLLSETGASARLPRSLFEQAPELGSSLRLAILPANLTESLPHPLARNLLTELLNPPTP